MEKKVKRRTSTEFALTKARHLQIILSLISLLFLYIFSTAFLNRPQTTLVTLFSLVSVLFFLASETSTTLHASQKTENKFWMGMSALYLFFLFLAPDSPIRVSLTTEGFLFAASFTTSFTYMVHFFHKRSHRRNLEVKRFRQFPAFPIAAPTHLLDQINACLDKLDSTFIPNNMRRMFDRTRVLAVNEQRVLELFAQASKEEVNYLVLHVNMCVCVYRLKNHHFGPTEEVGEEEDGFELDLSKKNYRNALMELLAVKRLDCLTASAKASLLDALQVVDMKMNPKTTHRVQQWMSNIVLHTVGDDLLELKLVMDSKGSVHSMHKLVYHDIDNAQLRANLLSHFQLHMHPSRKVISDVDDTFLCSGGHYPAGIDSEYPRHAVYPGAMRFYQTLGGKNLIFLSARPHVYKDMSEARVYAKFERMIQNNLLHTMPTLLPGDLESGQAYMLRGDFEPMAQKKLRNMVEYYSLHPNSALVFVGDNGQADVRAAELMLERLPMECIFIHLVQPLDKTFGFHEKSSYETWRNMVFYKTFVGAAIQAVLRGMIDVHALRLIMVAAREDFNALKTRSFPLGVQGMELRRNELATDFVTANELLISRGVNPVSPPSAMCLFSVGTIVHTKNFGPGVVRDFRTGDGIYKVQLHKVKWTGYFPSGELQATKFGATFRMWKRGDKQQTNFVSIGTFVRTPFGEGVVRRFRPQDGVYEVMLTAWPAVAFLQENQCVPLPKKKPSTADQTTTTPALWELGKAFIRRQFLLPPPSLSQEVRRTKFDNGTRIQIKDLGWATVTNTREEDSIVTLQFQSFVSYANLSQLVIVQVQDVAAEVPSPPAGAARFTTLFSPKVFFGGLSPGDQVEVKYFGAGRVSRVRSSDSIVEIDLALGFPCFAPLSNVVVKKPTAVGLFQTAKKRVTKFWGEEEPLTDRVQTAFGSGTLVKCPRRRTDGICQVKLDWGGTAFVNSQSMEPLVVNKGRIQRFFSLISPQTSPRLAPAHKKQQQHVKSLLPLPLESTTTTALHVGVSVLTKFGPGTVERMDLATVHVRFGTWPAFGVLQHHDVVVVKSSEPL